mgnify:CR=1 FL=1
MIDSEISSLKDTNSLGVLLLHNPLQQSALRGWDNWKVFANQKAKSTSTMQMENEHLFAARKAFLDQ